MPQILFIAEFPATKAVASSPGYPYEWIEFESAASAILAPLKACKRHQKNAWLLPAENSWPFVLDLSNLAVREGLAYSVLLIAGDVIDMTGAKK